mmetsp:Transcript_28077/g.50846  ORF Transcript_28077/g.50846 Transcript_28077/m.50846 type:complete len:174 (+) Transcript_28077:90-611(+)
MRLVSYLSCLIFLGVNTTFANLLDSCRSRGFDPLQLSCDTCTLLPQQHKSNCLECCQSFQTLHGQPQRFPFAVLLYNGQNEEIMKFMDECLKKVHHVKGSHRLVVEKAPSGASLFQMMSSTVYWMEQVPPNMNGKTLDTKLQVYENMAKEQVIVEGWQKADLEDMLLTILEDA